MCMHTHNSRNRIWNMLSTNIRIPQNVDWVAYMILPQKVLHSRKISGHSRRGINAEQNSPEFRQWALNPPGFIMKY